MLKRLISKILPYRISLEENDFINENQSRWTSSSELLPVGVLVEGFNCSPASIVDKARLAKIVEDEYDLRSVVICPGFFKYSCKVAHIFESFKIKRFMYNWLKYFNLKILFLSFYQTLKFYRSAKKPSDIIDYQFSGILIGDLIYDTIIRYTPGGYTITQLKLRGHFRHVLRAFANVYYYNKIFSKYKIIAVVTSHTVYVEYGILSRIGHRFGAKVLLKDHNVFKVYEPSDSMLESCLRISNRELEENISPEVIIKANSYISRRFGGTLSNSVCGGSIDLKAAFHEKQLYSKETLFKAMKIPQDNINNINVFVMAHAFSDAPHFGESLLFNDYYCWLIETLKCLSATKNINIFLKSHPSSSMWNEEGAINEILSNGNYANIKLLPTDFNTASIKYIADYVVSAQGTAGLEFSCFGIPAITAAKGWYDRFGFTYDSCTKQEYFKKLSSLNILKKLSQEKINTAKALFYLSMMKLRRSKILPEEDICPGDDYTKMYRSQFREMAMKMKDGIKVKDDVYEYYMAEITKKGVSENAR